MTKLGKIIKSLREQRGWTQQRLALVADVSLETVQRTETTKTSPRQETLMALADAFETDVSALLSGFSREQLDDLANSFTCPHCSAPLSQLVSVSHEYGDEEIKIFECGFE